MQCSTIKDCLVAVILWFGHAGTCTAHLHAPRLDPLCRSAAAGLGAAAQSTGGRRSLGVCAVLGGAAARGQAMCLGVYLHAPSWTSCSVKEALLIVLKIKLHRRLLGLLAGCFKHRFADQLVGSACTELCGHAHAWPAYAWPDCKLITCCCWGVCRTIWVSTAGSRRRRYPARSGVL